MGSGLRRRGAAALVVVLAATVGCVGDDDDDDDAAPRTTTTATTTTTEATTTTVSPAEAEVIAAVQRGFQAIDTAYDPPNPDHPDLSAAYAGEALEGLRQTILLFRDSGQSQIGEILDEDYEVIDLVGDTASVRSCTREQFQDIDTATREARGEPQVEAVHAIQQLERIDGTWKIVRVEFLDEPCPLD